MLTSTSLLLDESSRRFRNRRLAILGRSTPGDDKPIRSRARSSSGLRYARAAMLQGAGLYGDEVALRTTPERRTSSAEDTYYGDVIGRSDRSFQSDGIALACSHQIPRTTLACIPVCCYRRECFRDRGISASEARKAGAMKKTATVCMLILGSALLSVRAASAQTATFMLVPNIPGSSIDDRHANWIDVASLTQTLQQTPTLDRVIRERKTCAVEAVKSLDVSGPLLWAAAVTGQAFDQVRIEVVGLGGERRRIYEIKLMNARITGISTTGSGSYAEKVTLHGDSAVLSFFPQRADGSPGPPVTATFECN